MIDVEQLKALVAFLDGLTELSHRTGVAIAAGGRYRPDVTVNGHYLALDIVLDSEGITTYRVDPTDGEAQ